MNCDQTSDLLSDRLKGLLTTEDGQRLDAHLATCPACREEADAVAALWTDMGALDDDDVPREHVRQRMRARFHAALAAYDERSRSTHIDRFVERFWPRQPAVQAGIAVALLIVGVVAGRWLPSPAEQEIASLRQDIRTIGIALLDHQSASERLRGVEWSRQAASNSRVLDALLETVRSDRNVNVRLAAVRALTERLDRPGVGPALTAALSLQEAPLMQVTLAEALLEGNVDGSVAAIERMVEREELDPSVREYLRSILQEPRRPPGDLL